MKVKVRKSFRDSATGKVLRTGQEVEFEVWRAKSLCESGFVLFLEEPAEETGVDNAPGEDEPTSPFTTEAPVDGQGEDAVALGAPSTEKQDVDIAPEKDEQCGPGKRGRKSNK